MTFVQLLAIALTAAITENMVFCRGLGQGFQHPEQKRVADLLVMGCNTTLLTTLAAVSGWLGQLLCDNVWKLLSWTRPLLYLAIYAVAIMVGMLLIQACGAVLDRTLSTVSAKLVYGFVPLGTLFVIGNGSFSGWEVVFYGFGTGAGFLLASLVNYSLQRRLQH
ncbi:MAG: Rnf-Nqr domain containing protein, partial [Angelakisella sp.]